MTVDTPKYSRWASQDWAIWPIDLVSPTNAHYCFAQAAKRRITYPFNQEASSGSVRRAHGNEDAVLLARHRDRNW